MSGYINISGNYDFGDLGIVHVNVKSNARSVRARWRGGEIIVSAPRGIEYDRLLEILRGFAPKLESVRPKSLYYLGQRLEFDEFVVEIRQQTFAPAKLLVHFGEKGDAEILVGTKWDMESADTMKTISQYLCRIAQTKATDVLLPRARELSDALGCRPMAWTISNGHRVLGHCNTRGVIALSYVLVLYPQHLRDYVIYHELAHLSEMNHSPRFHEILDGYCDGCERQLSAELRSHKLPIIT